ncbi:MAG: hypothetical protein ACR2NN_08065 [Bryobacteraceae bacterium]
MNRALEEGAAEDMARLETFGGEFVAGADSLIMRHQYRLIHISRNAGKNFFTNRFAIPQVGPVAR